MKVLILNSLYSPYKVGGAEKSVQLLAEELSSLGQSISVLTLNESKDQEYIENGVRVISWKYKNIYWGFSKEKRNIFLRLIWHVLDSFNFLYILKMSRILKKEDFDVIHTNNTSGFSPIIWLIANLNGIKIVHTLRDYSLICPNTTMFKNGRNCPKPCLDCKLINIPRKILSKNVDSVVGISPFILEKHQSLGFFSNTSKEKVIGNSVDAYSNDCTRKINHGNLVFGFIGQISESKGVSLLLDAFANIENELLIAGNGNQLFVENLKKSTKCKNVKFLGYQNSSDFFNKIDVLIVPSLWNEPFGRVVVEGISSGIIVIGSNRGGISGILPKSNLFEPNKGSLLDVILEVIKAPEGFVLDPEILNNFHGIGQKYLNVYEA